MVTSGGGGGACAPFAPLGSGTAYKQNAALKTENKKNHMMMWFKLFSKLRKIQ